ncbi:hypothetical protein SAMN06264849_103330 [Melghirimyces algeriensis]|uniref:Uncharacterized protein n=1 Tax=Melghirimyces algeriensis TaxID=910412 RepID=A0A521CF65_9BACL|nr:hypothetical protein SAMN06264849_103330 [Melghirimyces algeriensis]
MGRYRRIAQALPETAYKVNKRGISGGASFSDDPMEQLSVKTV